MTKAPPAPPSTTEPPPFPTPPPHPPPTPTPPPTPPPTNLHPPPNSPINNHWCRDHDGSLISRPPGRYVVSRGTSDRVVWRPRNATPNGHGGAHHTCPSPGLKS